MQKSVDGVMFISEHHLVTLNICTKFHENNFDGIKVIEWTRFSFENFSTKFDYQMHKTLVPVTWKDILIYNKYSKSAQKTVPVTWKDILIIINTVNQHKRLYQ